MSDKTIENLILLSFVIVIFLLIPASDAIILSIMVVIAFKSL